MSYSLIVQEEVWVDPWTSYTRRFLEQRDKFPELNEQEFNQQPASLFVASVDTTSATLQSLILALVLHPEVQEKAHEEMDRVVGQTRSPTWEDEPNLPYLQVRSRYSNLLVAYESPPREGDNKGNGIHILLCSAHLYDNKGLATLATR